MALNLARNSRLFVSTVTAGFDSTNTWEVLVQDGFSFSQGTDTQDITVNEAGTAPIRGSQTFNTQMQPADWSFTSYVRSYEDADTNKQSVEGVLWAGLCSNQSPDFANSANSVTGTATKFDAAFDTSDVHELLKLNLYFQMDKIWYVITDAQVNQAEVDFSIDGIAMITWSGQGSDLNEATVFPDIITYPNGTNPLSVLAANRAADLADYLAVPSTATYIKNKLSTLSLVGGTDPLQNDNGVVYDIAITGGSLTINNNITYVTPETLSVVDSPIGSFTGARQVSGSMTCYLNTKANGSSTLLKNLSSNLDTTNRYALTLNIGGPSGPRLALSMPTTQLTIPVLDVQDVLGVNIDFTAQGSVDVGSTNELTVAYYDA